MSDTELAQTSDDFLLKALKAAQEATSAPKAHCHKSPKRWLLIARHVVEDGMDISAFLKTSGVTRNNYYDIKRFVETHDDYESIRAKAALDAATDYEIGVDLERAYTEKMIEELEKENEVFKEIIREIHAIDTDEHVREFIPVIDWDRILNRIGAKG